MKYLEKIGEFGIIDVFRKKAWVRKDISVGIGDDCAIIKNIHRSLAVSCDAMIEGVHFLWRKITPKQLGWKALATSLSDLAACGAEPLAAFLVLGLRGDESRSWLSEFSRGVSQCAGTYGVSLAGGDTVQSPSAQIVSFTVLGKVWQRPVLRSGARKGDLIGVCGTLGDAAAGLEILLGSARGVRAQVAKKLVTAQLQPKPQFAQSIILCRFVASMIDTSDGLLKDLAHICAESGVGARLDADRIPLSDELKSFANARGKDALSYALTGGEDYRLLFTVAEKKAARLLERLKNAGHQATLFGQITAGRKVEVFYKGRQLKISQEGFEHFRK